MPDKPETKTYCCEQCPKTFTRSNSYKVHLMKHGGKRYSCNICDKSYTASHSLKIHKQLHFHPHERPYKCQYCEASFVQSGHRNRHEKLTHGTKQSVCRMKSKDKSKRPMIVCRVCKRMFCSMSSYKVHERKHKGERHYCTRCAKSFTTHTQLTRHEQDHDEITKYKCDQCDKTFNRKSNLARHKHLHTGKHRYVCHVCGKAFILFEGYSAHLNVHQDQPATWCNVCGQSFKFLSSLKAHKKMHSNEKDYKCDICYRVFLRKRTLEDHLKVHAKGTTRKALITTPVAFCQMCSKGFSSSYGLQRHMRKHRLGQLKTYNRIQNQVFTPPSDNSNTKTSKEKTVVEHTEVPSDNAPGFHKIYPEQFAAATDDDDIGDDDDNEDGDDNVCITVEHSPGCSDMGDTITVIIHETDDLTENTGSAGFDLDKSINHDNSDVNMMDDIPGKDLDNNGTVSTDYMMETVTAQTVEIHNGVLSENMSVSSSNNPVEPVTAMNQHNETCNAIERGQYINQCNQILTSSESGQNMNQTNQISTSQSDTQGINQGNEIFNLRCDGHSNGNKLDILGVAYQLCQDMNVTDSVIDDFVVLPTTGTVSENEIQEPLNDINFPEKGTFSNTDAGYTPDTYFAANSDTQAGIVVENVNIESTHTATICANQTNQTPPQITNSNTIDKIKIFPSSITPTANVNRSDQRCNQPLDSHIGDEPTNRDLETFSNLDSSTDDDTMSTTKRPESQDEMCHDTPHVKLDGKQDVVQFECQYCMSQYATYKSLRAHLYRYHRDGENNMYTCDKCGKMFASKVIYLNHVDNHKWRGVKFDKDIECESCGDIFKSHLSYYRHMRIKHHVYENIGEDKRIDSHVVTQVNDSLLATGNIDETQNPAGGVNMARSKNSVNTQNDDPLPHLKTTHSASGNTDEDNVGIDTNKHAELNHCSNMGEQIRKHNISTSTETGVDGLCIVENNSLPKQALVDNSVVNTLQSECIDKVSNALGGSGIESRLRSNKNSRGKQQSVTLTGQAEVSGNESPVSNKTKTPTRSIVTKPTLYKCEECDQSFSSKWNKQNHMTSVHSDKFLCENCPKRFSNLTNLKRHIEIHHTNEDGTLSKNHMCPECGKFFTASDSLRIHMYSHTGERPYQCDQCAASYTQLGHLQRHINTAHIKQPVYQCQHTGCAKTFYNQSSLKMHEKIHSEIRAYQCTVCSKTFKTPYVLNHHTKTHADTKDHECSICHQFLSTRHSLQRHLERHQAVEKMNPASSNYDPNYHVNVRQRCIKKMGDKTYECESCMSKFTTKRALQAHKKKFCRGHEIK